MCLRGKKSASGHDSRFRSASLARKSLVIAILLSIGVVELNPGPAKIDDVLHRMDALIAELADTLAALERKIDTAIQDIAVRVVACEKNLTNIDLRLTKLEATLAFTSTEVNTL